MEKLYQANKDKAEFIMVYIKEAHPEDGWKVPVNEKAGITVNQPTTDKERDEVAKTCTEKLGLTIPCVVDGIDNKVGQEYAGWPDRAYIVGKDGKIFYKSGPGPAGFKVPEIAGKLEAVLKAGTK